MNKVSINLVFQNRFPACMSPLDLPGKQSRFANAARTLWREKGCRRFDVGLDANDPARVFLYELFDDREAFEVHSDSVYLADFFTIATDWVVSKEANRCDITSPNSKSGD